jgi:CxxC motif-containing protein (DUF1111 family)
MPDPVYGDQFSNFAVQGVTPEGQISLRYETVRGKFADGTPTSCKSPATVSASSTTAPWPGM